MENCRPLNVITHITLTQFLKELSSQRNADLKCKTQIRVYDSIGNEIYDSIATGNLISDFELFAHLDDQVKKAYETDYEKYLLVEIISESSLKSVEPLTLDGIYEKCMNEIKDLRTELNSIKSQLNKATEQNKTTNGCASIRYPEDWFSAQSNRCASIRYPNGFVNWLEKVHFI